MKASVTRDSISGLHIVNDIPDGEYSADKINKIVAAQQAELSSAITADVENGTGEEGNPALGDAMSREVRPSYFDANSKADRFGI